ncbi:glycosyltransferase involved in cell wall biosynthesis [Mariniflexile fucanivorans]|uniref:Glycosyltransferase involved in cell wall biosynthesis n=1 Tax=Mariniflexile fucanivorans TaxID=264023 RepID=A0A4R1RTC8_9FLAO|nr:glycosyltransferase [Mariniflexile fucanivorans]TCL69232.1 glycosyltransferase involved in cell wall biosynthesis [Mariniflexile fucanivorans]
MKEKKILIVDFNGTSAIYTHYLSNGLKCSNVEVFILGKKKPPFLDVFKETNTYLGVNTGLKLIDYLLNWIWLLLNFKKFDGIVIQWLQLLRYFSFEVYLVSFLQKKIPVIYIVHNLYPHNNENFKIKKRYNLLYNKVKNIAVQTKNIKTIIHKINGKSNIIKIQHGLFFKEFRKPIFNSNSNNCLIIGYISKYKGIEDAIEVAKMLKESQESFFLEIIGYGEPNYIEALNKRVLDYNLSDRIKIYPNEVSTNFLIKKIVEASMLWLPYKEISQSGVAYTSIGLGVPFVAYNVGNFKEAFGTGKVVEIVEKDNVIDFCKSVQKVLRNNGSYRNNINKFFPDDLWSTNSILIKEMFRNVK